MRHEDILLEKIKNVISLLNEIDSLGEECSQKQSKTDLELSDWLHILQHEDNNDDELVKISKRIKELRKERESLNYEWELLKVWNANRTKLVSTNNREFLLHELDKTFNQFNKKYNNRVLTEEKVAEVLGKEETIKRSNKEKKEIVENLLKDNPDLSNSEIHSITGISQNTVAKYRKEIISE